MPPRTSTLTTRCVVAGGGPGGMMLGYLLARAGVDVVVLEKHGDFLRDFRGDTIHPSTLEVIRELGLMDRFRPLLQNEIRGLDVVVSGHRITPVRLLHAAAAVRVPRADAAVGLPGLPGGRGAAVSRPSTW